MVILHDFYCLHIFGHETEKVIRNCNKLQNAGFRVVTINSVIKWRKIRWERQEARTGNTRDADTVSVRKPG